MSLMVVPFSKIGFEVMVPPGTLAKEKPMVIPLLLRAMRSVLVIAVTPPPGHRIMPTAAEWSTAERSTPPTTVPKSLIPWGRQGTTPRLGVVTVIGKRLNVQDAWVCARAAIEHSSKIRESRAARHI